MRDRPSAASSARACPGVDLTALTRQARRHRGRRRLRAAPRRCAMLKEWLEAEGFATLDVGLARSTLVSAELEQAKEGNVLGCTHELAVLRHRLRRPAREPHHPRARRRASSCSPTATSTRSWPGTWSAARDPDWVRNLYGMALVPDVVFYLKVTPAQPRGAQLPQERRTGLLGERDGHRPVARPLRLVRPVPDAHPAAVRAGCTTTTTSRSSTATAAPTCGQPADPAAACETMLAADADRDERARRSRLPAAPRRASVARPPDVAALGRPSDDVGIADRFAVPGVGARDARWPARRRRSSSPRPRRSSSWPRPRRAARTRTRSTTCAWPRAARARR